MRIPFSIDIRRNHIRNSLIVGSLALIAIPGLATMALTQSHQSPATETSDPAASSPQSPAAADASAIAAPDTAPPAIADPLFSSVILPLPPLLLPDLLLPPYDYPSFDSERLDQELQLYSRYLRIYGPPDVLIVGSSRSLQGIDPIALQTALKQQGYPELKIYNFGINGATAQVIEVLLQEVLTAEQMPRLLVWGDGLRAFNSGRPDLTHQQIVASVGYRRLATGDRPIPARVYDLATASRPTAPTKALNGTSVEIDDPLADPLANQPPIAPDLDMFGFQAVTGVYDPTTYYQQYPRVPGYFDADYVPFELGGVQSEATIAVARFAREQTIPLVVVNLPLTQDYMDAPRQTYERQFVQHLQQLAQQEQFIFVDLNDDPALKHNHFFVDPSHINQSGAQAVGTQLAVEAAIPWQMFQAD